MVAVVGSGCKLTRTDRLVMVGKPRPNTQHLDSLVRVPLSGLSSVSVGARPGRVSRDDIDTVIRQKHALDRHTPPAQPCW